MEFIFNKDLLIKEINIAQEIISSKNALSILSNVFLSAQDDTLIIRATDIKVSYETRIPVEVKENGETTIFCDKFISILNSLPQGDILFSKKDIIVEIKPTTKKINFNLKSISSEKFPSFASSENNNFFEFPVKEFKEMITQTIFAVSDDENRFFINGIFFEKDEENLILVSTDARRLAYIKKSVFEGENDFVSAIVPTKILSIIQKRMPTEGNIKIAFNEKMIFFQFGNYEFNSVLIEGQYPNYKKVIPERQLYKFSVLKSELSEALRRVSLLVEKSSKRIYFNISSGNLTIYSQESDIGKAQEEIECDYEGEDIIFALNHTHIEEPLKVISSEKIIFEFTENMKSITLFSDPKLDFIHVIMPLQVD
ncbi:MAG: DNA polymerase III subunit beta [Treponemataceae bacterium]